MTPPLFGEPKVAMCPSCEVPLVATFAFDGKEFICLRCGALYEWLEPTPADSTPELLAQMHELEEEWVPIGSALLSGGVMRVGCETCSREHQPHILHATPEEIAAHEAATERVKALSA